MFCYFFDSVPKKLNKQVEDLKYWKQSICFLEINTHGKVTCTTF